MNYLWLFRNWKYEAAQFFQRISVGTKNWTNMISICNQGVCIYIYTHIKYHARVEGAIIRCPGQTMVSAVSSYPSML